MRAANQTFESPKSMARPSLRAAHGSGWGLWHRKNHRWVGPYTRTNPYRFATRREAEARKAAITGGKRNALMNYWRLCVVIRPFPNDQAHA